jgi:lipoprotein NlpD
MYKKLGVVLSVFLFTACSSAPQAPAPVVSVYTGKTFKDFKANAVADESYKVSAGDTLYSIAFRAGKDYREIAEINQISAPYTLKVGRVIKLTSKKSQVKKTAELPQLSDTLKAPSKAPISSGTTSNIGEKKAVARSKNREYGRKQGNGFVNKTVTKNSQAYASKVNKWIWPAGGKLLTKFSSAEQGSKGIDIAGRAGEKVVASADGKVVYAGNALRGYGNLVIIKHTDDYLSAYAHNSKLLVKEKQWVKAGESVALMGNTDASRVQLHFEIRYRGKSIDPLKHLPAR